MYAKHIRLKNYRNYELLDLELGKRSTVFIGKNGMGKTNLIAALKQSLSFIFAKNSVGPEYEFIASSDQRVKSFTSTDSRFGKSSDGSLNYIYPVIIETMLSFSNDTLLTWSFEKNRSSESMQDKYSKAASIFWNHYEGLKGLPVITFFSDSYPHLTSNIGKKIQEKLNSGFELPRNVGYHKWDDEKNCNNLWLQYFTMQWKNNMYNKDKDKSAYIEAVTHCLVDFSQPLNLSAENIDIKLKDITIEARGKEDLLVLIFENGKRMAFETLPQGYRRIFSIVFDIANRSYILNKNCNPSGIAFIDEVELHLHPSIAQEILDRLLRSFPKLQFIVSTHSPLVLSNFKQDEYNIIYKLESDNSGKGVFTRLSNVYGIDYNSMLISQMETPVRNSFLKELCNAYTYWKNKGDTERMNKVLDKISGLVGSQSTLVDNLKE